MASFEEVAELDAKGERLAAFHMLTELAHDGSAEAAYMLGIRSKKSTVNIFGTYAWFYIADLRGHPDANIEMNALKPHMNATDMKSAHIFARAFI